MNKKIGQQGASRKNILLGGMTTAILFVSFLGIQKVDAAITNQLDFGSRGADVTELQTYLAANTNIYPSGLITGYFGPLTQTAVERFQVAQGIVSEGTPETTGYGRVGPRTMIRVNALNIQVVVAPWDPVPVLSNPSVQRTNTSAIFTWTSNEPTQGQVYYDTAPLRTDEATALRQQPYVSGTFALDGDGLQTNHTVMIQNLRTNTVYYYLVRGIDSVGNMSMTWPNAFRTNQ